MSVVDLGKYDFIIRKGDTLRRNLTWGGAGFEPTDITGWDAELVATDVETGAVVLEMNTGNSKILIDGPNLKTTLYLSHTESAAIDWTRAEYTLKLIDTPGTGDNTTYITGIICAV